MNSTEKSSPSLGKTIEGIVKYSTKSIVTIPFLIIAVIAIVLLASFLTGNPWLIKALFVLFSFVVAFVLLIFLYFAIKDPNRLHNEDHIYSMTAIALGSKNPKAVNGEVFDHEFEKNLKADIETGPGNNRQIE